MYSDINKVSQTTWVNEAIQTRSQHAGQILCYVKEFYC
jgi:hypothetical protein